MLDVRPKDEFAAGHIRGARKGTLAQLERSLPTLAPDAEIVAYCCGPYCVEAHQSVATKGATRGGWKAASQNGERTDGGCSQTYIERSVFYASA